MSARHRILAAACALGAGLLATAAPAQPESAASRGALLYETHCGACHTAQVHWRERRLVQDWPSLTHQVWRWQGNANLGWTEADIESVARHLNRVYYKLPEPGGPPARGEGPATGPAGSGSG